ncbi:protein mono-ADP-ribosyltransferase PARP10 isoform X1 [Lepisosteus oculatus]|uniref:protein mono-ADP-ribosyltransferase PARP10 isoform X1 n=1 Tax=Lepisosteus oculatus TaxID=7918 RepID=UPI0035F51509
MTDSGVEERTVEVSGIPASVEDEILGLYFENARRSGGGPLASLRRKGDAAVLVFEDAEVAARVLSRGPHNLQNATLTVRKPAPKDRGKLLLRGINPQISMEVLELYVENVTGVGSEDYTIYLSPERDIALIQFQRPLSETEFSSLWGKVSRKLLDGAQLSAELIEQTDSILVENLRPTTSEDMLTLYFENKRGGGEEVKDVSMLTEGIAKVSFEDYEAVDRVIQRSHMLDGNELKIRPYFDFLQPKEKPSSPVCENGKMQLNGNAVFHSNSSENPQTSSLGPAGTAAPGVLLSDALETPHSDISAPEVLPADQAGEARAPSPQLCSSCVSLPDPLKLSLLQDSHLLQDLQNSHCDFNIQIIDDAVEITGPSQLGVEQLKNQILESFSSIAQAHLPFDEQKATLLSKVEVKEKLMQNLKQEGLLAKYTVSDCVVAVVSPSLDMVKQASSVIKSLICSFTIPVAPEYECMLYSKEWTSFLLSLGCCCARVSSRGDQIEVTTLRGMEEEKESRIVAFLSTPVQVETVIAMEPGMLKYIQTHCHTLLADMDQVTIFPLEEEDVTGLRLHGNANACQIADELLRSVVSSVCTRTIVLNRPGVARFLVQEEAARILEEMQTKFQVFISLDKVHWEPLDSEDIFEVAKKFESQPNFQRFQSEGGDITALPLAQTLLSTDVNANDLNRPDRGLLEEAKRLVSVIDETSGMPVPTPGLICRGMDLAAEDLYTDREATSSLSDNEGQEDGGSAILEGDELRPAPEGQAQEGLVVEDELTYATQLSMHSAMTPSNLEEDAMLSLAIQYSMESKSNAVDAEDELLKVLELSKKMVKREPPSADPVLEQAIHMSLQDAIKAAHTAEIQVFAGYSCDLIRVDIALGKKVGLRQCEEKVEHRCLKNLSEQHRKYVDIIQRKHAVDIQIQGSTATIQGFKDYVSEAVPDVKRLIKKISASVPDSDVLQSVQWVWHDGKSDSTPYPPSANVFIENAWKMKEKRIDILFDSQPYTIDFGKMEEYNIVTGKSVRIARKLLSDVDLYSDLPEEDLTNLSSLPDATVVCKESDEFQDVVSDFYDTIREYHNKIKVVKVEKLTNRLLYNQYKLKKASMLQSAADPEVERTLYHGTNETSVKEISIHGFNRSFCGKNATVYGQGVYFAVDSALSVQDQYSPPNADGHKFVFVAKVLTGDYTKGRHEMKTAPLKENTEMPLRYHSVVDTMDSPSLFVIFNDTQAYPEYLITCQKM